MSRKGPSGSQIQRGIASGKPPNNQPRDVIFAQQQQLRVSPFPPPDEMRVYEELCPGFTREFLDTYKNQSNHRQSLESVAIRGDDKRATRAQFISAGIVVFFGAIGAYLIVNHFDIAGYVSLVGVLAGLIGAFFGGAIIRYAERKAKAQNSSRR